MGAIQPDDTEPLLGRRSIDNIGGPGQAERRRAEAGEVHNGPGLLGSGAGHAAKGWD